MPWFKVDDALAMHMKAFAAGNKALGLWVRAGSWSMQQLSDGFIPVGVVPALGGDSKDAASLVGAGLWHEVEGGYQFHDWDEYQPTREQVEAEREKARERMARVRANKDRTSGEGSADVRVTPSRPVPSRPVTTTYVSESQSLDNRARASTDATEVSPMTKKLAGQKGLTDLSGIAAAVGKHTTCTVTPDQAFQVAVWLLDKAKSWPSNPQRYVLACIRDSAGEVEQHIYEAVA